jgi:hypothetical protein
MLEDFDIISSINQHRTGTKSSIMGGLDFVEIYNTRGFDSDESHSGKGSSLAQTKRIREALPSLLSNLNIRTLLDVPCGDFHWMRHIINSRDIKYIGGDVVKDLIVENIHKHGTEKVSFAVIDVRKDDLLYFGPDAIFCRDLLVHLPLQEAVQVIDNFRKSGAKYLIITTFSARLTNSEELMGNFWRPLNMEKSPFNFPTPLAVINEACTESIFGLDFSDKCLGVWKISDI